MQWQQTISTILLILVRRQITSFVIHYPPTDIFLKKIQKNQQKASWDHLVATSISATTASIDYSAINESNDYLSIWTINSQ